MEADKLGITTKEIFRMLRLEGFTKKVESVRTIGTLMVLALNAHLPSIYLIEKRNLRFGK